MTPIIIAIHCTTPSKEEGTSISQQLLAHRLVACAQIIPNVTSHYIWNGSVEESQEFLLILKTIDPLFSAVSSLIKQYHSYDLPEIIAHSLNSIDPEYRDWISQSVDYKPLV